MDFKENLESLRRDINTQLESFFDKVIKKTSSQDKFIAEALKVVKKNTLSGGKRIRPILMCWGYWGAGGKKQEEIIKASVGIELIHSFLLIHDDIMVRDILRHGRPTINAAYETLGREIFAKKNANHFGNSMAIIIGDMIGALGNQVIFDSDFEASIKMKALSKIQEIVSLTVVGQYKDIYMEYKQKAQEDEVIKMYEYKTAKYTLEGPLHLGAILGGGGEGVLEAYTRFSLPVGIAFQIQDDILGIFGSEEKVGKKIGSDISSGKQTLLVVKALENASRKEREEIRNILGKENIKKEEIEEFRKIMEKTGSLDYANNLAKSLIEKGKKSLEDNAVDPKIKKRLISLADYLVVRKK